MSRVVIDPGPVHLLGWQDAGRFGRGLAVAVSMKTAGILFVFASMVIPPMPGLVLARRVWGVFVVSLCAALLAIAAGLVTSFSLDLPTGPAIICAQGALFVLALLLRVRN